MEPGLARGAAIPPPIHPCEPEGCGGSSAGCTSHADCDHTDPCLIGLCDDGSCIHLPYCWDLIDCTVDTCADVNGSPVCTFTPDDTLSCDDDVACTDDACDDGDCIGTPNDSLCDDGKTCTVDVCSASSGCSHIPLACNDFDFCTDDSFCDPLAGCCVASAGCIAPPTCVAPTDVCINEPGDQRCVECADDLDCTDNPNGERCEEVAGVCVECAINDDCPPDELCDVAAGVCVECFEDVECLIDPLRICDATGTCVHCRADVDCDDANPCTDQTCVLPAGTCQLTPPIPGCCQTNAECNDDDVDPNGCTDDSCCLDPNGCCDTVHCVALNECFFDNDSDNDTVENCADACRGTTGCPQNNANDGCPCVCCNPNDSSCCDPDDPNPLCSCP